MYGLAATDPNVPDNPCNTSWYWTIPSCWGWTHTLVYGDKYPSTPMPPAVGSTLPDGSAIPAVPASGQAASDTVQAITNQQILDTQAQNQQFFEDLNPQVNLEPTSIPWWVWALGGVAVFAVVTGGGGRR